MPRDLQYVPLKFRRLGGYGSRVIPQKNVSHQPVVGGFSSDRVSGDKTLPRTVGLLGLRAQHCGLTGATCPMSFKGSAISVSGELLKKMLLKKRELLKFQSFSKKKKCIYRCAIRSCVTLLICSLIHLNCASNGDWILTPVLKCLVVEYDRPSPDK